MHRHSHIYSVVLDHVLGTRDYREFRFFKMGRKQHDKIYNRGWAVVGLNYRHGSRWRDQGGLAGSFWLPAVQTLNGTKTKHSGKHSNCLGETIVAWTRYWKWRKGTDLNMT